MEAGRGGRGVSRAAVLGIAAGLVAILVVVSLMALVTGSSPSPRSGPVLLSSNYVLNNSSRDVSLSFPACVQVTANWSVVSGSVANFSVWPPEAVLDDCGGHAARAPVGDCPSWACGGVSMGPGPVCFETGTGGVCEFYASQPGYDFLLATPSSASGGLSPLSGVTVEFTISCSYPASGARLP